MRIVNNTTANTIKSLNPNKWKIEKKTRIESNVLETTMAAVRKTVLFL